jgi:6-phosphofructokinase 1
MRQRQGGTLGEEYKHWFRAKFLQQFRLFFRYQQSAGAKIIVLAWVNDEARQPKQLRADRAQRGRRVGGYKPHEYGEPDPYGHRKKANVAESLADEIKRCAGDETITSDLIYDLRSGDPDFIDKVVALTFGNMATYDAILEGKTGLMSALVEGRYDVPIPDVNLGPRKLDVASTYNTERYRPIYANKRGLPIFLNRAS